MNAEQCVKKLINDFDIKVNPTGHLDMVQELQVACSGQMEFFSKHLSKDSELSLKEQIANAIDFPLDDLTDIFEIGHDFELTCGEDPVKFPIIKLECNGQQLYSYHDDFILIQEMAENDKVEIFRLN